MTIKKQLKAKADQPASPLDFLTSGRRWELIGLSATSFIGGLCEALFLVVVTRTAFAITDGTDDVELLGQSTLSVNSALVLGFTLIAIRLSLALWTTAQSAKLLSEVVATTRERVASAFLHSSWATQQGEQSGRLQELLTTFTGRCAQLISSLALGIISAFSLLALVGMAIAVDFKGALAVILGAVGLGAVLRPLRNAIRRRAARSSTAGMNFATSLSEVSQLGMEIHVFQLQDAAEDRIKRLVRTNAEIERRLTFAQAVVSPVYTGLAYIALLGALSLVALADSANITALGAIMLIMLRSLSYGQSVQTSYANVTATTPYVESLQAQIRHYESHPAVVGSNPVGEISTLEFDDVHFAYAPGQPVLRSVSFSIESKEVIGIVGPSGSGKSTLVQLLLGLREPTSGSVLVDGKSLESLSRADWARRVTFVPQENQLIDGTIAENIRLYRSDISDDAVERAAQLAHLDGEIRKMPDRFDHILGPDGGSLSGGQKQRLCIARALVETPDVLILDEPTSALDIRSEQLVRQSLLDLSERMTVIIIAHRLSTLDICDKIMVIEDGRLKAFGTPSSVGVSNSWFREVVDLSSSRPGGQGTGAL